MAVIDLREISYDRLRLLVPTLSDSQIIEGRRKIRATWKDLKGKISDEVMAEWLRKESIFYLEMCARMKSAGLSKGEVHSLQERLVGHNPHEFPIKLVRR